MVKPLRIEKNKNDNARRPRGETLKNAWRNLKRPMAAGNCIPKDSKNDFMAGKVESHESTRQRVESSLLTKKKIKIAFAGKGFTSMTHYNFGSHIYSYASSNEDSGCKSCIGQGNGKSSRQSQHGNWRKSRARKRLFSKRKETKLKSTLPHW